MVIRLNNNSGIHKQESNKKHSGKGERKSRTSDKYQFLALYT
jgi:hypothetical protein